MKLALFALMVLLALATGGCAVAPPEPMAPTLRINEVVAMSLRGDSDATVIAQLQQRGAVFALSAEDLEQQRAAGVSDGVLRYLQGRGDGDQALRARILAGRYPVPGYPGYYGSSYLGSPYLGYNGGRHYYGGPLRRHPGGHLPLHHGGHHGGGHH